MVVINLENGEDQKTYKKKRSNQKNWRNILAFTLMPFILWGAPIHKLFLKSESQNIKIDGILKWILYLFKFPRKPRRSNLITILSSLFTIALLPLVLYFNYLIFRAICHFLVETLILGNLELELLDDLYTLYQFLPLVIPLDYIWIYGYKLKRIFDYLALDLNSNLNHESSILYTWFKLGGIYALLITIHIIRTFIYLSNDRTEFFDISRFGFIRYWIGYTSDIMYTLIFPHYLTLTWLIREKFKNLNKSIQNLIQDKVHCTIEHLQEIKKSFTITSEISLQVNKNFRSFLSWGIFIVIFGIFGDLTYIIFTLAMLAMERKNDGTIIGMIWTIIAEIMKFLGWINLEMENDGEVFEPSAENVRGLFLQSVMIGLKITLLVLTRGRIKNANDEAKNVFVHLNDFVSEQKVQGIEQDVYHTVSF